MSSSVWNAPKDRQTCEGGRRIAGMLLLSLVLHFLLFALISGLHLPLRVERPLSSYEVALVAMPLLGVATLPLGVVAPDGPVPMESVTGVL